MSAVDGEGAAAGQKAVSGAVYLGLSQIGRLVLTTLSTIVIARLLTPDDYGVMAMAAPVIALILMFQDLGLSAATIQKPTLTQAESSALFWINLFASLGVALALVAVSPLVGWFYGDPRAGYVTAASAIAVLVSGIALQHGALLNRHMRFAMLSGIDIANALATFLIAAAAAFFLRSYWALFLGTLAGSLVQTILLWRYSSWRPDRQIRVRGAGDLARFGGHVTGFNLVNFFVRNADFILIARFAGSGAVGLYDRSYKLMMLPLQNINAPVNRLLLPLLSRLHDQPAQYRRTFTFAVRAVMLASAPGIAIATALSDRLMPFLLGERWAAAGPIFFWLGLTGLVQPIANMTGVLFMSSGRAKTMMHWGLFSAAITLLGFAIGLYLAGPVGVAASLFVTMLVRLPLLFALSVRGTSVRQIDLYGAQFVPLFGAGIAVAIALAAAPFLSIGPLLCFAIPLAYTLAIAAALLTPGGRETLGQAAAMARPRIASLSRYILRKSASA